MITIWCAEHIIFVYTGFAEEEENDYEQLWDCSSEEDEYAEKSYNDTERQNTDFKNSTKPITKEKGSSTDNELEHSKLIL